MEIADILRNPIGTPLCPGRKKENICAFPFIHILFAQVLFHLWQPQLYLTFPLHGCLLALTTSLFSNTSFISNTFFLNSGKQNWKHSSGERKHIISITVCSVSSTLFLATIIFLFGSVGMFSFDYWGRGGRSFQWAVHCDTEVFPEQWVNLEVNNAWLFILFLYGPKRLQ